MKEFIEEEKGRLQALFEPFNTGGSWMTLADKDRTPVRVGIVDGFTVTRVAPQFDAGGDVTRVDFWILIRLSGYDEGFQHAHTVKIVSWSQDDTYLLDLLDDWDRRFHIELIIPDQEPNEAADWKRWRDYRAGNLDRFKRIDAELLTEHTRIAQEWE